MELNKDRKLKPEISLAKMKIDVAPQMTNGLALSLNALDELLGKNSHAAASHVAQLTMM